MSEEYDDFVLKVRILVTRGQLEDKGLTKEAFAEALVDKLYDGEIIEHASVIKIEEINKMWLTGKKTAKQIGGNNNE